MARTDRLVKEVGLPRRQENAEDVEAWIRQITEQLLVAFRHIIDAVNLLIDGYLLDTTLPTASVTHRGRMVIVRGGAGVIDKLYWCRKTAADTYEWKEIV